MQCLKITTVIVAARISQAMLGFAITGLAISQCPSYYSDLATAEAAAWCGGGIGVEALLGLLAVRKADFDWLLVLTMDLLALGCCITAIALLTLSMNIPWWQWNGGKWPNVTLVVVALAFVSTSVFMLLPSLYRALQLWRRGRQQRLAAAKEDDMSEYESWPHPAQHYSAPAQNQNIVEPVRTAANQSFDIKSAASSRPLSAAETTAGWSEVSGDATLRPSTVFSEKRPPSYASPLPSRTPTAIHRKALN